MCQTYYVVFWLKRRAITQRRYDREPTRDKSTNRSMMAGRSINYCQCLTDLSCTLYRPSMRRTLSSYRAPRRRSCSRRSLSSDSATATLTGPAETATSTTAWMPTEKRTLDFQCPTELVLFHRTASTAAVSDIRRTKIDKEAFHDSILQSSLKGYSKEIYSKRSCSSIR